jgi:ADP-glucose pyrophosphorylase
VIGERARVERDARVTDSVLWNDVTVRRGASLTRCVVVDGADLPAGGAWENAVILAGDGGVPVVRPMTAGPAPGGPP